MPHYIFTNDYTSHNREKSNSEYFIFRAGQEVIAEPYAANPDLPEKIRNRVAPSIIVAGKFIVPSNFVKLKETRSNAEGAVPLPKEKMINLKSVTMNINKGGVAAGALIGVAAGIIFAVVSKKSKFFYGAIGLVVGGVAGQLMTSSASAKPSEPKIGAPDRTKPNYTVGQAPKTVGGVPPTMSGN